MRRAEINKVPRLSIFPAGGGGAFLRRARGGGGGPGWSLRSPADKSLTPSGGLYRSHEGESESVLRVWRVFRVARLPWESRGGGGGGGQVAPRAAAAAGVCSAEEVKGQHETAVDGRRTAASVDRNVPGKKKRKEKKAGKRRRGGAAPPTWTDRHFNPKMNADMHSHSPQKRIYLS